MDFTAPSWLPLGMIEAFAAMPYGTVAAPALIALVAFLVMVFSVPGAMTPTAFLSGLLLGIGGLFIVLAAAALGSHVLFVTMRSWIGEKLRARYKQRLNHFAEHFDRRGALYIASARFGGVPHVLVSAGAAATKIRAGTFAVASLVGMLPILTLAALAGSGVAML